MGVVNVTPDSFSDGGEFQDAGAAIAHGTALIAQGADIIDVGGEATNPRAEPVPVEVELGRILPVIRGLVAAGARVSVDTTKAAVAREAVAAGATIVNDVSGGLFDPGMSAAMSAIVQANASVTYIAGHLRGRTLAEVFESEGTIGWRRVAAELADRVASFSDAVRERIWVDPGIGFGKGSDPDGNLSLIRHAGDISTELGRAIVIGASRKRFLRKLLPEGQQGDPIALDVASVAAGLGAVRAGAFVVRTHNVALLRAALAVYTKL
ncbi:MAG: dihydropteroate synthase [Deltaproteobacteria bacterium]|nr:dihydropteroate synthase [Deltaproteobacteria bacterium]